jgi:hypothetical protein
MTKQTPTDTERLDCLTRIAYVAHGIYRHGAIVMIVPATKGGISVRKAVDRLLAEEKKRHA